MTMDYPIVIVALSDEDGGGFMGHVPDLRGCMSDGATRDEAARNTELAILEWLDAAEKRGLQAPPPGSFAKRAEAEKSAMMRAVKEALAGVDQIEARLHQLERSVEEIQARFDDERAWVRFSNLTGHEGPQNTSRSPLLC